MLLRATTTSFLDDGHGSTLAFSDGAIDPKNFVILSITNRPDEQDVRLGLTGVYLETSFRSLSGYQLIDDFSETAAGGALQLKESVDPSGDLIPVEFGGKSIDGERVPDIVALFKNRIRD